MDAQGRPLISPDASASTAELSSRRSQPRTRSCATPPMRTTPGAYGTRFLASTSIVALPIGKAKTGVIAGVPNKGRDIQQVAVAEQLGASRGSDHAIRSEESQPVFHRQHVRHLVDVSRRDIQYGRYITGKAVPGLDARPPASSRRRKITDIRYAIGDLSSPSSCKIMRNAPCAEVVRTEDEENMKSPHMSVLRLHAHSSGLKVSAYLPSCGFGQSDGSRLADARRIIFYG